ncbi:MAG: type II toxin-antitoxin system RelE/ParE family toxin [Polyangiaceae bacterium]|nr:type II toxin-antitoxin system RelE/ParE family toxin [Polyangiaceae bacterium]
MGEREGARPAVMSGRPLEIRVLQRAEHDLLALGAADREAVARRVDALAADPMPRGAQPQHGAAEGHLQLRVGRLRLLYRVRHDAILVVAITGGPV